MSDLLTRPKPHAVRSRCRRVIRAAYDRAGLRGLPFIVAFSVNSNLPPISFANINKNGFL